PAPRRVTATPLTPDAIIQTTRPPATRLPAPTIAPGMNPLTGLPVAEPGALDRRPLAIKISNAPDTVRPQAGIAEADLVFEHLVEGGLTRFTAVFWTHTPPRVGSIRSARLIDLDIPVMTGALFAYSGASNEIRDLIAASPFAPRAYEGVTTGEPLYFRDPGVEAPHNLFVVPAQVWERAAADGWGTAPDVRGFVFDTAVPDGAQIAVQVQIDYGPDNIQWTYDAVRDVYQRAVDGVPHHDANTGVQVTAANVVIVYAHHADDPNIIESQWQGVTYYSTRIDLLGSGPATVCRVGRCTDGFWRRDRVTDMLSFWTDEATTEALAFTPGNTWFQIVPLDFAGVKIE
ncbi:MAG: DUF3048 domain-containing protein, partial [Anaerolineae bacterium]|nr:DUF3048 domain-containing protein [Anaerolineae bacterium]